MKPAEAMRRLLDQIRLIAMTTADVHGAGFELTSPSIAGNFGKTRNLEETITNVLEPLLRLSHVSSKDGKSFEIRRVA
jgi:hypothetical protein